MIRVLGAGSWWVDGYRGDEPFYYLRDGVRVVRFGDGWAVR